MKKIATLILITLLVTMFAWAQSKPGDLEDSPRGPRPRTFAPGPAMSVPSAPLKLIAADSSDAVVSYSPEDVTVIEKHTTDPLVAVDIPKDPARTHLLLCFGGTYSWERVPSDANYRFQGRYDLALHTPALAGAFHIASLFDGMMEYSPSTIGGYQVRDPARCFAVDQEFLVMALAPKYGVPQAQALALDVVRSSLRIEMTAVFGTRSVDYLDLGWPYLQVWGD